MFRIAISPLLALVLLLGFAAHNATADDRTPAVNINTADASELASELSGVGMARAEAIIEYREANGEFASADDLLSVSGIGSSTVEANRDRIVVE